MKKLEKLKEWDKTYLWHPFTQMKDWLESDPLIIDRAEGVYLIDIYGKRYIDGVSSIWCNVHGHRHPFIDRAIKEQLEKVAHTTFLGLSHPPGILLAKKLVEIAPDGLTRVFYSDNGATSVEVAIKMARGYWYYRGEKQRTKFIALKGAYHGDTIGAMSLGGIPIYQEPYSSFLFPVIRVEAPYCYRCPFKKTYPQCGLLCLEDLERALKEHADEVIAFIIEPIVQGAAGIIVQPPTYLKKAWELCKKYGVLFIADEVATGFGRTGKMFACEHEEVKPDLMCLSKGLTGGYLPLAVTLSREEIFQAFLGEYHEFKAFFHGHTYTGNPLACAASLGSLEVFEKEGVLEKLQSKIRFLEKELKRFWELDHVGDIRQKGFMVGIELVEDPSTKKPFPPEKKVGQKVVLEARKRGVIIRPLGDVIVLMPPLSIGEWELTVLIEAVYESIKACV